jgi:hypothetical protein
MPRDSSKILLSGQNLFKLFTVQNKKLIDIQDYANLPEPKKIDGQL